MPGNKPDNSILINALDLQTKHSARQVALVSKDINLRIKAAIVGVHSEDYHNDRVLDDLDLLYTGYKELPADFWQTHGEKMDRSEERRVGKECVSTCRSRWSQYH